MHLSLAYVMMHAHTHTGPGAQTLSAPQYLCYGKEICQCYANENVSQTQALIA